MKCTNAAALQYFIEFFIAFHCISSYFYSYQSKPGFKLCYDTETVNHLIKYTYTVRKKEAI